MPAKPGVGRTFNPAPLPRLRRSFPIRGKEGIVRVFRLPPFMGEVPQRGDGGDCDKDPLRHRCATTPPP
jgi:hypothetical protein